MDSTMVKKLYIKITFLIIVFSLLTSVVCFADETEGQNMQYVNLEEIVRQVKGNPEAGSFSEYYERNELGQITKRTQVYDNKRIIIEYTYNSDGSFNENSYEEALENFNHGDTEIPDDNESSNITLFASVVDLGNISAKDSYIKDPTIQADLKAYSAAWSKALTDYNGIRYPTSADLANLRSAQAAARAQANILRADYVVSAPYSDYAKEMFGGTIEHPLSRVLTTALKDTQEFDVMVIQRILLAEGYISADEIPNEDFGYYGDLTYDAVWNYQTDKGIGADGKVYTATYESLFGKKSDYGNDNQRNTANSFWMSAFSRIVRFRLKHDYVKESFAAMLRADGTRTVFTEKRIDFLTSYKGLYGVRGIYGMADIIRIGSPHNNVWEVKAYTDTPSTLASYRNQVAAYVAGSNLPANKDRMHNGIKYCPFVTSSEFYDIHLPYGNNVNLYAWTGSENVGANNQGLFFYSEYNVKRHQEQPQESLQHQESYQYQSAPSYYPINSFLQNLNDTLSVVVTTEMVLIVCVAVCLVILI